MAIVRTLLTGPDMIIALTIAQMALENRDMYGVVLDSMEITEDELSRIYEAVSSFLEVKTGHA
jgi:hypothetical protein